MSNRDKSEWSERYPFEFWTEGALGRWAQCMICNRDGDITMFVKDPKLTEYREIMCPTCGVILLIQGNIGRSIWNFMCKVHYNDVGTHVMETRYF